MNTFINHSDDGGARDDKEKREQTMFAGAEADLSLVCYSINYQLTFLLFQESVSTGLLSRIVLNDGINSNSSLHP